MNRADMISAAEIERAEIDPRSGTWSDPMMHPYAIAPLDRVTIGRFALDHDKQTARLLETGPIEVSNTGLFVGVTAEVTPYAEAFDPDLLPGLDLALHSYPFEDRPLYRIVSDWPSR